MHSSWSYHLGPDLSFPLVFQATFVLAVLADTVQQCKDTSQGQHAEKYRILLVRLCTQYCREAAQGWEQRSEGVRVPAQLVRSCSYVNGFKVWLIQQAQCMRMR